MYEKVSDQLIEYIGEWLQKAMELLSRPRHYIPLLSEMNQLMKRKEHKQKEEDNFDWERENQENNRGEKLTLPDIQEKANDEVLSNNDKEMRLSRC